MCLAAAPLALGIPNKFVLLSAGDSALMLGVAATSFVAQLLSTCGLQIVVAAKAAAMGFTQVSDLQDKVLWYTLCTLVSLCVAELQAATPHFKCLWSKCHCTVHVAVTNMPVEAGYTVPP
jgi:hypothetical protein